MAKPLISLVLPVRNAAQTLSAALASVRAQSEPRFECIVVDDGSDDESAAIVGALAVQDSRFELVRQAPLGIVSALNRALERARGRFVARMDGDDLMHRSRLERQLSALEQAPELAGVGCHVRLFPRRSLSPGLLAYERWLSSIDGPSAIERERYVECPLAHPTFFFRRECMPAYAERGWPEDYDLLLRLLSSGHRLGVVPEVLLLWRDGPARLSRTGAAYRQERFTACKAYYLAHNFLAGQSEYVLWGYGDTGKALCRALADYGKHPSQIVELHPGRVGQRIAGAPVIAPSALKELLSRRLVSIVVSVAGLEARSAIRKELAGFGLVEGSAYVCAA